MRTDIVEFVDDCGYPGGFGICFTNSGVQVDGGIWGLVVGLALFVATVTYLYVLLRRARRRWRDGGASSG